MRGLQVWECLLQVTLLLWYQFLIWNMCVNQMTFAMGGDREIKEDVTEDICLIPRGDVNYRK